MAVRFGTSGNSSLTRTANLPTSTAFTICGWSRFATDTNNFACIAAVESDVSNAADDFYFGTTGDGTSLALYSSGVGAFSSTLVTLAPGDVFFWAMTASGAGAGSLICYHKALSANALSSVSTSGRTFTTGAITVGSDSYASPYNGRIWEVKCWDRALTPEELLVESAYERVMYPASLNFHWPLSDTSDLNDRSGNGRAATATGTLTTEDNGGQAWAPSSKIFIPAGAGGISGSLSGTLGDLTGSAASTLPITGSLAVTLGAVTTASSGAVSIAGLVGGSLAPLTSSATGVLAIAGQSSPTLGSVVGSATAVLTLASAISATLDALTSTSAGALVIASLGGGALAPMTGASEAALSIAAQVAATLGDLTGSAEGVGGSIVVGSVSSTLDAITTTSAAQIQIQASTSGTLSPVTLASQATLAIAAQGAATFGGLTALCAATIADPASPAAPASNSRFIRNFAS